MELERVTLAVRPRGAWESIDLGLVLARAGWRALWSAWLVFVVPVALLLWWVIDEAWVASLVIWWLKPAFDRIALDVLSRAVFGDRPTLGETLRRLGTIYRHGTIAALTYLRVDFARSLQLPVWQLEGLRGARARARRRVIAREGRGAAVWLSIVCVHLELVVFFGLLGLLWWMAPTDLDDQVTSTLFLGGTAAMDALQTLVYIGALTVIEPLYVAAGFSLYLNRRTRLEAWDVELGFRRMAARIALEAAA